MSSPIRELMKVTYNVGPLKSEYIRCWSPVHFFLSLPGLYSQEKAAMSRLGNQNIPGGDYRFIVLKPDEACQTCIDACLNDCYLPSFYELKLLYLKKGAIGLFADSDYWSSTGINEGTVWRFNYRNGVIKKLLL